jgi:YfiH family protein
LYRRATPIKLFVMLHRVIHANGVVTYQSPLLNAVGVRHAFATRIGGISAAPFDSLNLGNPTGCQLQDDNAHLQKNYDLLQQAIGAGQAMRCWVRQVHGTAVGLVEPEGEGEYAEPMAAEIRDRWNGQTDADALITDQPNVLLTVRVADCVPLLLASRDGRVVAAVHAGWRGVVFGVAVKALQAMADRGVVAAEVIAAIGPGISLEEFEVGPEVAGEFIRAGLGDTVRAGNGGKSHVDLQGAIRLQLATAGVNAIDGTDRCTVRNADEFFSHRRDRGITGRMAAVVMCKEG